MSLTNVKGRRLTQGRKEGDGAELHLLGILEHLEEGHRSVNIPRDVLLLLVVVVLALLLMLLLLLL